MEILDWKVRGSSLIDHPCIVKNLSSDEYHGNPCVGPSISSSGLRLIESKSPAHYWVTSPLNPKRIEKEKKKEFDIGKAAHSLLLSEGGFRDQFAIQPTEYPDKKTGEMKPWHNGSGYCKEWNEEVEKLGRTIVTEGDLTQIRGMAESLAATPEIADGLFDGLVEHSIFWQDKKTGIWLKSRPDVIPRTNDIVADLKTTTDASPREVDRTIANFGYFQQLALVQMGLREVADMDIQDFILVFVEKEAPWAVTLTMIDPAYLEIGRRMVRRALDTFAKCLETGMWEAYGPLRTTYAPDWLVKQVESETKFGLMPMEDDR